MPRPSHTPRANYSNNTWLRVQIMKLFIMQFSPFSCHLISLRSKYIPKHPVLKHPPCLCSSLNVWDHVSHPYGTTGKIIVLYILISKFFDSNREDRFREMLENKSNDLIGKRTATFRHSTSTHYATARLHGNLLRGCLEVTSIPSIEGALP
jgi:hypothetical protein